MKTLILVDWLVFEGIPSAIATFFHGLVFLFIPLIPFVLNFILIVPHAHKSLPLKEQFKHVPAILITLMSFFLYIILFYVVELGMVVLVFYFIIQAIIFLIYWNKKRK